MLRDHCNDEELMAHLVLDMVREGFDVPDRFVKRALFVLGDGVKIV